MGAVVVTEAVVHILGSVGSTGSVVGNQGSLHTGGQRRAETEGATVYSGTRDAVVVGEAEKRRDDERAGSERSGSPESPSPPSTSTSSLASMGMVVVKGREGRGAYRRGRT